MPPQRPPSSPTSLLWAHELKREHGFLLDRMKKLEEEIVGVESRTKEAAGTARADDVAAIAKKVQRLTEDGGQASMEKIREEVMERFEDVGAEIEAVTLQVSNLERSHGVLKEKGRRAVESEKALLRRIKDVEGSVGEYEQGLLKLGKRIDELAIGKIREALEGLSEDVKGERVGWEIVQASLVKLDEAGKVLREGNERLAEQVKELAERPIPVPVPVPAAAAETAVLPASVVASAAFTHEPEEAVQDSRHSPTPVKKPKATKKTAAKAVPKTTRKPAPRRAAAKTQPRSTNGVATLEKAAADIHEPLIDGRLNAPIVRRGRGWIEVEEEEPDNEDDESKPDVNLAVEPTNRRGRPLKTAAVQPTADASASSVFAPVKRGPGRPKKNASKVDFPPRRQILQPDEVDQDATVPEPQPKRGRGRPRKNAPKEAPASRRTIVQPEETQQQEAKSYLKRTIEQVDGEIAADVPEVQRQPKKRARDGTPEPPPKRQRRGLTNIFTSPLSSSVSPANKLSGTLLGPSKMGQVFQSETSQPSHEGRGGKSQSVVKDSIEVQPPRRRTIVQLDDEDVLRSYHEDMD